MDKFIEELHKKGTVKNIQRAVDLAPEPTDEIRENAIRKILLMEMCQNSSLEDIFVSESTEMAISAVIKRLDIKKDPNAKPTRFDEAIVELAEIITANIKKLFN